MLHKKKIYNISKNKTTKYKIIDTNIDKRLLINKLLLKKLNLKMAMVVENLQNLKRQLVLLNLKKEIIKNFKKLTKDLID